MITNGFTYIAVLLLLAATLVTLEKNTGWKFFKFIPAVVLLYLLSMVLCTLGVWDMAETKPAYSALKNSMTYAMIFTMLLRCDIRKIIKLGPKMLLGFFTAAITIMVGFVVAFLLMKGVIGSDAWMGLGALCGSWLGGSGNMVAVQAALDISEADMGYALVIDSIDYSLWVMFLLWAIQLAPKFNKWTKADTKLLDELDVVVPVDQIANYLNFVRSVGDEVGLTIRNFGHAGDGNLHIYACTNDLEFDEFWRRNKILMAKCYAECKRIGGQLSGEHGIGWAKKEYLEESVGEVPYRMMQAIKNLFDPNGILNPGKVCS